MRWNRLRQATGIALLETVKPQAARGWPYIHFCRTWAVPMAGSSW